MQTLPVEFISLAGKVNYIQQISENEWHSSCPNCGGEPHADGSYPDRFIMWKVSRRGTPFGMCVRKCGFKWSPEKQDANWTVEERAEFARKQIELEAEWEQKEAFRIEKLSELVTAQLVWKRCHDESTDHARKYWEKVRGIPLDWQDELFLGYMPNYTVRNKLTSYKSPAFTLPVFGINSSIENITLRVEHPLDGNDRYRRLYKSKAQHIHSPQRRKANKIIIMEGEIKADIATIYGWLPDEYTVYGMQSKAPERRLIKSLSFAEVVYVAFDPDAYVPEPKSGRIAVMEVAKQLGMSRTRFVIPPNNTKFDDAILKGYKFMNAVNMAVKAVT